jgi:hypothetical protein
MSRWNINALESPRVFYLREGSTLADAGEKISRLAADEFRVASAFAFLSTTPIVFDATSAVPLLQYAAGKPVVLLVADRDFSIKTDQITEAGLAQLESEPIIQKVRNADLLQLLHEDAGGCVLGPHENYHFVTPSLNHTTTFIRIGDLLHNVDTLDRFAFWLRPHVGKADAILADNWSIASLILRTLQLERLDLPFDCLQEHPTHNSAGCRTVVESLLSRIPVDGKLVAFVSISGSGKLVQHLKDLLVEQTRAGLHFECWSIFGDEKEQANELSGCFAILPQRETYTSDDCVLCKLGSVAIQIDPAAYHLKSQDERLVLLTKTHAEPAKPFIETYKDTPGLFLVHHDDRNDGRHHAFDLNMITLISHPEFAQRLLSKFKSLEGQVDLVITPNHELGKILAVEAAKAFHCPTVIHDTLQRADLSPADADAMAKARKLLIVDDVVNSGSRLMQYVQSVREGQYGPFGAFNYLVALARPSSPQNLSDLSKSLTAGHPWQGAFHAIEEIILPAWSKDRCPWCQEFDFISRIAREFSRPPQWLSRRLAALRDRNTGITDEPLLLLPGVDPAVMGEESPICPGGVSSMVATFLFASALQRHRWDPDPQKQLHPGFPVGNVMSPKNVSNRYTEGLIRAILLRLVQRAEWGQAPAIQTRDFLLTDIAQGNQKVMAGELFFALGRSALRPISSGAFLSAFAEFFENDLETVKSGFFRS